MLRAASALDFRAARRFRVSCRALIEIPDVEVQGTLTNLSVWGCALRGSLAVQPGDRCRMTLQMPNDEPSVTIELARVRWRAGEHCGVEFLNMPVPARSRLRRFLLTLTSPARI